MHWGMGDNLNQISTANTTLYSKNQPIITIKPPVSTTVLRWRISKNLSTSRQKCTWLDTLRGKWEGLFSFLTGMNLWYNVTVTVILSDIEVAPAPASSEFPSIHSCLTSVCIALPLVLHQRKAFLLQWVELFQSLSDLGIDTITQCLFLFWLMCFLFALIWPSFFQEIPSPNRIA